MQDSVSIDRDKYIGGSDIPIIMSLSPYKSRYDLLLEKAGYKTDTFKGNKYTEYGNTMEAKIRDYINSYLDNKFVEGKHIREAQGDEVIGVRIHTDGEREIDFSLFEVLEIKTTDKTYETLDDYKIYIVQLLFYMVNVGAKYGRLAVYKRPEDLSEDFNPDRLQVWAIELEEFKYLVEEIGKAIESFIEDLKKVKANPNITEDELIPIEIPDLANKIISLESQMKDIDKMVKKEISRLKEAMEAASIKTLTTPNGYKLTLVPDGVIIQKIKE